MNYRKGIFNRSSNLVRVVICLLIREFPMKYEMHLFLDIFQSWRQWEIKKKSSLGPLASWEYQDWSKTENCWWSALKLKPLSVLRLKRNSINSQRNRNIPLTQHKEIFIQFSRHTSNSLLGLNSSCRAMSNIPNW